MQLGFCKTCGHIYNYAFNPDDVNYAQNYDNSLHFSPRFQEYAKSLATRLIESHKLYNKDIIEIGCGSGDFLSLLCELGGNRGVGFDPSTALDRNPSVDKNGVTFINDFYSERYANYKADLICCRHVLEHMQYPRELLLTVRRSVGNRSDTIVFFEVPNSMFTLEDLGIWDLIYEHPSYFSTTSLGHAFISCGFMVENISEEYDDQFIGIEATPNNKLANPPNSKSDSLKSLVQHVNAFEERYKNKLEKWKSRFDQISRAGQRAVVWGAGSKGVTFLNALQLQDRIEFVIDISPEKQGRYVSGTGQKIVPPNYLHEYRPDIVIVMNPIYQHEIHQIIKSLNPTPTIIVA